MILVGERRAEERHDPVAHHLVDGALVAVDGLHHALEHGVEELARLLGIAVGEQLHRALEVGEEHGDLLALALEGGLGGEDPLGEVLRRVDVGRREVGQGRAVAPWFPPVAPRTIAEPVPVSALAPQPEQTAASGAPHCRQNRPRRVLRLATGTLHRGRPPNRGNRAGFLAGTSAPSLAGGS